MNRYLFKNIVPGTHVISNKHDFLLSLYLTLYFILVLILIQYTRVPVL